MDVLYLDFDGVLHPGEVWCENGMREPRLRTPGHQLFESVPVLEDAIAPYRTLKIVLSTTWVRTLGFEQARDRLSAALQSRVIGATYDPQSDNAWRWDRMRRYDTIALDVQSRRPSRWLALDDDALGWAGNESEALVFVPANLGLKSLTAQDQLRTRLAARFS
jgi:hypothetical protein